MIGSYTQLISSHKLLWFIPLVIMNIMVITIFGLVIAYTLYYVRAFRERPKEARDRIQQAITLYASFVFVVGTNIFLHCYTVGRYVDEKNGDQYVTGSFYVQYNDNILTATYEDALGREQTCKVDTEKYDIKLCDENKIVYIICDNAEKRVLVEEITLTEAVAEQAGYKHPTIFTNTEKVGE